MDAFQRDDHLRLSTNGFATPVERFLARSEVASAMEQLDAPDRVLVLAELRRFAEGLYERGLIGASDLSLTFFPYAKFCCLPDSLARLRNSILPDEEAFAAFRHENIMAIAKRSRDRMLREIEEMQRGSGEHKEKLE